MSWELLAGKFVLDLFMGGIQGSQQRSAAMASNKEAAKLAKANFERDEDNWELGFLGLMANYAWKMAETESARYVDSVKKADYEKEQSGIIDTVIQNLILNAEGLEDKYVAAEQIRYDDEVRSLLYRADELGRNFKGEDLEAAVSRTQSKINTQSSLASSSIKRMLGIQGNNSEARLATANNNMEFRDRRDILENNRAMSLMREDLGRDIRNDNIEFEASIAKAGNNLAAAQSNRQALTQVAQYMNQIKQNNLASNALLSETENTGADIQEQIVLGEQIDTLERDAKYVAAIADSSVIRNQAAVRQGGSNSSNKISLDAIQAFGRTYGQMRVQQNVRRQQMAKFNASVQGKIATQFASFAQTASGLRDQVRGAKQLQKLRQNEFIFNDQRIDAAKELAIGQSNVQADQNRFIIRQEASDKITQLINAKNAANGLTELTRLNSNRNVKYEAKLNNIQTKAQQKLDRFGINRGMSLERDSYRSEIKNNKDIFNNSTLQGFLLGNRQGQREFQALVQGAFNQVNQAATPYRDAIINDPLLPIAGMKPELENNKKMYVPSTGSIILDTTFGAAKNVLDSAGTDAKGNLTFGGWAPWG